MIQRLIGVSIGALLGFVILWFSDFTNQTDLVPWFVAAVVIDAIASFFWPVVAGFWLGRQAKERRDDAIQREVDRQLTERSKQD